MLPNPTLRLAHTLVNVQVENNQRGVNASQWNLAHTGIGSFNDRVREACNGGSPFADPRLQGYLTGLALQPNGYEQGDAAEQAKHLDHLRVMISLGMAGNLRDFPVTDSCGNKVLGGDYCGVAYAASPQETVNYVSAHDNETLFDTIMLKVRVIVRFAGVGRKSGPSLSSPKVGRCKGRCRDVA